LKENNIIHYIDPNKIIIKNDLKKLNPRFLFNEGMEDFIESIYSKGVVNPVKTYLDKDKNHILVHGYRRMMAVLSINQNHNGKKKIKKIPTIITEKNITKEKILVEHFISNDNSPLKPIEEAKGFKQFIDWGWTKKRISQEIGKSTDYVHNRLTLFEGGRTLQKAVENKKISTSLAADIVKASRGNKTKQETLTKTASSSKKGKKIVKIAISRKKEILTEYVKLAMESEIKLLNKHIKKKSSKIYISYLLGKYQAIKQIYENSINNKETVTEKNINENLTKLITERRN